MLKKLSTGIEASATGESLNSGDPAVHPAARHKLDDGRQSGESWPSAWRWRRGVRRRQGKTDDDAGIRAVVELQPDFNMIQLSWKI